MRQNTGRRPLILNRGNPFGRQVLHTGHLHQTFLTPSSVSLRREFMGEMTHLQGSGWAGYVLSGRKFLRVSSETTSDAVDAKFQ